MANLVGFAGTTLLSACRRALSFALALAAAGCYHDGSRAPSGFPGRSQGQVPVVEAVEVRYGSLPLEERLAGSVRARNQTEIHPEVAGTIEAVFVDDGDNVAAGDPLAQLRGRDFEERVRQAESGLRVAEARVRQAEANLARVRADLERTRMIVERELGTRADLDAAVAAFASAEADLDLLVAQREQAASVLQERESDLEQTLVRAPIDGIVGGRNAEVGQQASTSAPLFVIGDVGRVQVDITLTQGMLGYIATGTEVRIYSDTDPDDFISAEIARISPYLHDVTHTTTAEIDVDEHGGRLRPGMYVTVDVLYGESQQAALVPNSALYRHPRDGREGVYIAALDAVLQDPERPDLPSPEPADTFDPAGPVAVSFVPVEVVARGRETSGIRGAEPGDWVVTLGHDLLADDDRPQAIVQPTPWSHILELQQMESRALLTIIEEKQERNLAAGDRAY